MGSLREVFYPNKVLFAGVVLASVSSLWFTLFRFLNKVFLRHAKNDRSGILLQENNRINSSCIEPEAESELGHSKSIQPEVESEIAYSKSSRRDVYNNFASENLDNCSIGSQEGNQTDSNYAELEAPAEVAYSETFGSKEVEHNDFNATESETPKFEFKFRFPIYEEMSSLGRGNEGSVGLDSTSPPTSASKYEFFSGKSFSHFLEEPGAANFTVKALFADSNNRPIGNSAISEIYSVEQNSVEEPGHKEVSETLEESEKLDTGTCAVDAYSGREYLQRTENGLSREENMGVDDKFLSEKDFIASDSDLDTLNSGSVTSQLVASISDAFLSEKDFEGTNVEGSVELTEEDWDSEDMDSLNLDNGYEAEDFDGEDSDILEELRKLEDSDMQDSDTLNSAKFHEDDFHGESNSKEEDFVATEEKRTDGKPQSENSSEWDTEDSNGLETLWEHQDLIEQLKMELKKVRATGLPTILEESECPKIIEDLKPWKIDEKFQHGDRMGELHRFYKSYRERMRKFDILNYQKMYAIGFLGSKDPLKSFSSRKSSASAIRCVFSQTFRLRKHNKSELDPMMKFITDLRSDLEVVYVGQMCLSWEILHWQYEKALELWDSDPYGMHQYNEVAGEFQQFQVLLQRFIENEPFQGPRVENYVKNRCVMRNLLQVPVIRGDRSKERKGGDGAITIDVLLEALEESMRIIWQFIQADKDVSTTTLTCPRDIQVELQDPADSVHLMELRTDLQKKEKKLRSILKSGHCILKKIQKHQGSDIDHHYFFCQVDMKLVSRILNMSTLTTDQLVWCRAKLSQINFVNRKMHVEPSFFLFPC